MTESRNGARKLREEGGVSLLYDKENAREMVVGYIRTLMNGSRVSVPIFPKIAVKSFGMIS